MLCLYLIPKEELCLERFVVQVISACILLYITSANNYSRNSKTFSLFSHVFNHTHHISISFTVGYKASILGNPFKFLLFVLFLLIFIVTC